MPIVRIENFGFGHGRKCKKKRFSLSATRFPNGTYCPPFLFECKNHVCVQPHWKCDGDNDCGDNSDEELHLCCKKSRTLLLRITCSEDFLEFFSFRSSTVEVQCETPLRFRCDNNRCIYSHELCNSVDDCGDGSDERLENCKRESSSPMVSVSYFSLLNVSLCICSSELMCFSPSRPKPDSWTMHR